MKFLHLFYVSIFLLISFASVGTTDTNPRYVFITGGVYGPPQMANGGADLLCQQEAINANVSGTYRAILAYSTPAGALGSLYDTVDVFASALRNVYDKRMFLPAEQLFRAWIV